MVTNVDEVCAFLHERMQRQDFVLLDTETEGLRQGVIDMAVIGADGQVLFDSLIRNQEPIEAGARKVHHITEEMCANAPTFAEVWPNVSAILDSVKYKVTYNVGFDLPRLEYTAKREGIIWKPVHNDWRCLMLAYARHWGEESWRANTNGRSWS